MSTATLAEIPPPPLLSPGLHYPTTSIDVWHLRSGERLTLRPVLPQDKPLLGNFYATLQPATRRFRFHGAVNALSDHRLVQMTEIDYAHQLALVATVWVEDQEQIVADARYVVDATRGGGEFAVVVADGWQRRGIGARSMAGLRGAARRQGLRWLWGDVLENNPGMLALLARAGFRRSAAGEEGGFVRVECALSSPPAAHANTAPLSGRPWLALGRWLGRSGLQG